MANVVGLEVGTSTNKQFSFADHAGSFAAAAAESLESTAANITDVQITLTNIISTAARQSDKIDLGSPRAREYSVRAAIEFHTTPNPGGTVDFYWFSSPVTTEANANAGNADGGDSAYTNNGAGTVASGVAQMQYVGSLFCSSLVGIQHGSIGIFQPDDRYGGMVVQNKTSVALSSDDSSSIHFVMDELLPEIQ